MTTKTTKQIRHGSELEERLFRAELAKMSGRRVGAARNVRLAHGRGGWTLDRFVGYVETEEVVERLPISRRMARQFIVTEIDWIGKQWVRRADPKRDPLWCHVSLDLVLHLADEVLAAEEQDA